jgi:hypothetical protein
MKRITILAPLEDMRQYFADRIICGRCGNSNWTKFTYMPPINGRVLVQCSECGLPDTKPMEPNQMEPSLSDCSSSEMGPVFFLPATRRHTRSLH